MKQEMVTLEVKLNVPRTCEAGDRGAGSSRALGLHEAALGTSGLSCVNLASGPRSYFSS